MKFFFILSTIATLFFTSCAFTDINSFADPDFAGARYKKIMVKCEGTDMRTVKKIERLFCEKLNSSSSTAAIADFEIFLPTREYSDDDFYSTLEKRGVDAFLILELTDKYFEEYQNPTYVSSKRVTRYRYGRRVTTERTIVTGGDISQLPNLKYRLTLYDTKTGRKAWIASSHTSGSELADLSIMIESLAGKCLEELKAKGMISN